MPRAEGNAAAVHATCTVWKRSTPAEWPVRSSARCGRFPTFYEPIRSYVPAPIPRCCIHDNNRAHLGAGTRATETGYMNRMRKILVATLLVGGAATAIGAGTFASFSA